MLERNQTEISTLVFVTLKPILSTSSQVAPRDEEKERSQWSSRYAKSVCLDDKFPRSSEESEVPVAVFTFMTRIKATVGWELSMQTQACMTHFFRADITWSVGAKSTGLEDRPESDPQSCFLMTRLPTLPRLGFQILKLGEVLWKLFLCLTREAIRGNNHNNVYNPEY